MKSKGQALVEFILVLPVLLMVMMAIFDLGSILYQKYHLENDLDYVVDLYRDGLEDQITQYVNKENLEVTYQKGTTETTISLLSKVKINTPILNKVMNSPYSVSVKRVIVHE